MSAENVEVVRRFAGHWASGEWEYQRGRGSGVELQIEAAVVFNLRDGRISRIQGYLDRGAALDAAGLS